jgi:hypothetical protein
MSEAFKIETPDDLRKIIVMAQGGDPEAQQTLNAFLKFNNNIERTNLPTRRDVVLIAYLDGCGKLYYPNKEDNPFSMLANSLVVAFMAKGGDKSKQFVELMKQTPNLADLQTIGTPVSSGLRDRIFGRKKTE